MNTYEIRVKNECVWRIRAYEGWMCVRMGVKTEYTWKPREKWVYLSVNACEGWVCMRMKKCSYKMNAKSEGIWKWQRIKGKCMWKLCFVEDEKCCTYEMRVKNESVWSVNACEGWVCMRMSTSKVSILVNVNAFDEWICYVVCVDCSAVQILLKIPSEKNFRLP